MLNKLQRFIRRYQMLQEGDHLVCAVSGGADSVALLFAMYLLRDKLQITLSAAHYNHHLRGDESDRDEKFVRQLCERLDIPIHVGAGNVVAGKKGLEAAAREARYAFLRTIQGKIATAHTADDNLETVLMHLVRGTGLKGLGGIAPVNGCLIRPMLDITRAEVLAFLDEYNLTYVVDSSNLQDLFLRNRLRKQVIPVLERENPNLAYNVTTLAQRLREDETVLSKLAPSLDVLDIESMRRLEPALRSRAIYCFLQRSGVSEPESKHILGVDKLIFSNKPSARVLLQDGIVISRNYDRLECVKESDTLKLTDISVSGETDLPQIGMKILCIDTTELVDLPDRFTIVPQGKLVVRPRLSGDRIRLYGGSKDLKKLYIDRKIPVTERHRIPVISDEKGVVGVYGFGVDRDRLSAGDGAVEIRFICCEKKEKDKNER